MNNNGAGAVYVPIKVDVLWSAIKGSGITAGNLATMVLNRDKSYLTTVKTRGTMVKEDLEKLCTFLSVNIDDVLIKEEKPVVKEPVKPASNQSANAQLDMLIVGLNKMYEAQRLQNETLNNLLIEVKAGNAKTNRLENALGQIIPNLIQIKTTVDNSRDLIRDIKSTGATISGRLRDLIGKFK